MIFPSLITLSYLLHNLSNFPILEVKVFVITSDVEKSFVFSQNVLFTIHLLELEMQIILNNFWTIPGKNYTVWAFLVILINDELLKVRSRRSSLLCDQLRSPFVRRGSGFRTLELNDDELIQWKKLT